MTIKRISVSDLTPGMIIAEDVYSFNNQLIFPKGLVLTDKAITRMELYSLIFVRVEEDVASPEETIPVPSYAERLQATPEFRKFKETFEEDISVVKEAFNDILIKGAPLEPRKLLDETANLIAASGSYINIFDILHNMRHYDDSTYVHCVNVSLICNVFARWLRMSDEEVEMATLCGMLHDIGKLMIPDEIIKKPDKLTSQEYRTIKTHPQEGYKLLSNHKLNKSIMNAALMHHERCDGSGYPFGLPADRIDSYAKLVSIADVYDAMTSARVYRGPLCPFIVVGMFENEGLQRYDTRFIMTFLENIVNTYLQHRVRLNNGIEGEVVFINPRHLSSPTIKCGRQFIDLAKHPELHIEALV
jgi:putative nucleotidyltransferase with HDIG domain